MLLALTVAAPMAPAAVLYKSVDANGVVMFSDMPPSDGARVLEERPLPGGSPGTGAPAEDVQAPGLIPAEQMLDYDAVIARANAQVDQAERALALARRAAGAANAADLRLSPTRLARDDDARLETYRNNVKIARRQLMELLRERRLALRQ